jgi:hypothetical protein
MAGDADTGGTTRARSGLESADGCDLGKNFLLHRADFGVDRLLVEGFALQQRGLGHLELLLGHCLLVAERRNGCSISGFGRDRLAELITEPGISSLKVGDAVLVIGDGALVLLRLVFKRILKMADNLHVFLDLLTQSCCSGTIVSATGATGTTEDVDVDVLGAR